MTETKLTKFVEKPLQPPLGEKTATLALLSASKGFNLKHERGENTFGIKFWCKSGTTIKDEKYWIHRNLARKIRHLDPAESKVYLYIWLGTCDTTRKIEKGGGSITL